GSDTPGGRAAKYHMSARVMFRLKERISSATMKGVIVGQFVEVEVIKNSMAPPFRKAKLTFRFATGFDPFSGLKDFLIRHGRIA
ncbi:DNA recombination/repair protein RecA, partial [Loigolactobacillus coryniformis]